TPMGAADVGISANGSLVYIPGVAGGGLQTVVSADPEGHVSAMPNIPPESYRFVRVSPDGKQLALSTLDTVFTYDLSRAALAKLTTGPAADTRALWTPDSKRIVFSSNRAGYPEIFWRSADGTGTEERLLTRAKDLIDLRADGWSADGRQLLFTEVSTNIHCALGQIPIERPSDVKVLVKDDKFCFDYATISPDGHWMAYESNRSGRNEIYVERYPELGDRHQVSTDGGTRPIWARDGRGLFFSTAEGR